MDKFILLFTAGALLFGLTESQGAPNGVWQQKASVKWAGTSLDESLSRFAEIQKIGLLIDRRIDPSIPLYFESTNQSLEQIIQQLAKSLDLGCVFFDSTVYLGPKEAATILPNLLVINRKKIENLPVRRAALFRRKVSLKIPFLSEPKEILQNLATQSSFHWKNPEILPHDLWDEKSLAGLSQDELLTILLIGFGVTFKIEDDGETLVLIPLPKELNTVSPVSLATPASNEAYSAVTQSDLLTDSPKQKIPLAQRRFTIKVEDQKLETLLQSLAKRLDRTLEIDKDSLEKKGVSLDSPISFEVKNATAAQLFQAFLRPLKLDFRIKDDSIRVW